jgi:hypothetical protein
LLGYIILGHPEWKEGHIKIFSLYAEEEQEKRKDELISLIKSGRLPISQINVEPVHIGGEDNPKTVISQRSNDADLTIIGFRSELIKAEGVNLFTGYENMGNILFVSSTKQKEIT